MVQNIETFADQHAALVFLHLIRGLGHQARIAHDDDGQTLVIYW